MSLESEQASKALESAKTGAQSALRTIEEFEQQLATSPNLELNHLLASQLARAHNSLDFAEATANYYKNNGEQTIASPAQKIEHDLIAQRLRERLSAIEQRLGFTFTKTSENSGVMVTPEDEQKGFEDEVAKREKELLDRAFKEIDERMKSISSRARGFLLRVRNSTESPEKKRADFERILDSSDPRLTDIYVVLEGIREYVTRPASKTQVEQKIDEVDQIIDELRQQLPEIKRPLSDEERKAEVENPDEVKMAETALAEYQQKLDETDDPAKYDQFDPRDGDRITFFKDIERILQDVIAAYRNQTGIDNLMYFATATRIEQTTLVKVDKMIKSLNQRVRLIEKQHRDQWAERVTVLHPELATLDTLTKKDYATDPSTAAEFATNRMKVIGEQTKQLSDALEVATQLRPPANVDPAYHDLYTQYLEDNFFKPARERIERNEKERLQIWYGLIKDIPEVQALMATLTRRPTNQFELSDIRLQIRDQEKRALQAVNAYTPADAQKDAYEAQRKKFWEEEVIPRKQALEKQEYDWATNELEQVVDEVLGIEAIAITEHRVSLEQLDNYKKKIDGLWTLAQEVLNGARRNSALSGRANDLIAKHKDAVDKLRLHTETIRRYPDRMSWDDLLYEMRKMSRDPYDWAYWRHNEARDNITALRGEWLRRTENRRIDQDDDAMRAFYKLQYALPLIKNILELGTNAPETKRSELFNQLSRTLLTRSEIMRGVTYNPRMKNVGKILRSMEFAGAKKPTDVGYRAGASYDYLVKAQEGGANALSKYIEENFTDREGYTAVERSMASVVYMLFDYLTTILLDLQRQTMTAGHGEKGALNRLMILDAFKHLVHVLTRYVGNEASPLAEMLLYLDGIPYDWGATFEKREEVVEIQNIIVARQEVFADMTGIKGMIPPMPVGQRFFLGPGDALEIQNNESLQLGSKLIGEHGIEIGRVRVMLLGSNGQAEEVQLQEKKIMVPRDNGQDGEREEIIREILRNGEVIGRVQGQGAFSTENGGRIPYQLVVEDGQKYLRNANGQNTHTINENVVLVIKREHGRSFSGNMVGTLRDLVIDNNGNEVGSLEMRYVTVPPKQNGQPLWSEEDLGQRGENISVTRKFIPHPEYAAEYQLREEDRNTNTKEVWKIGKMGSLTKVVQGKRKEMAHVLDENGEETDAMHEVEVAYVISKQEYGGKYGERVPVDFEGRELGIVEDKGVFNGSGTRVAEVDRNIVYDLDHNIIGYLQQTLVDNAGRQIGYLEPEVFNSKKEKIANPGALKALATDRDAEKISLSGTLAPFEHYQNAEEAWLFMIEKEIQALPKPLTEHMVLHSMGPGKGSLIAEWMKNGPGIAKMFPGFHLYYSLTPMFKHLISRIFTQIEGVDPHHQSTGPLLQEKRKIFWKRLMDHLEEMKHASGLSDFASEIDEVLEWMRDPNYVEKTQDTLLGSAWRALTGSVYDGMSTNLLPWRNSKERIDALKHYLHLLYEFRGEEVRSWLQQFNIFDPIAQEEARVFNDILDGRLTVPPFTARAEAAGLKTAEEKK